MESKESARLKEINTTLKDISNRLKEQNMLLKRIGQVLYSLSDAEDKGVNIPSLMSQKIKEVINDDED